MEIPKTSGLLVTSFFIFCDYILRIKLITEVVCRAQDLEIVISEQLFPLEFSTENRVRCWIVSFDAFDEKCVKAFEKILSDKQRYEKE